MKNDYLESGLLRVGQAAKRLGVSEQCLYRWCKEGNITYYQVGGKYRIPVKTVEDLLNNSIHLAKEGKK